MSAPLENSKVHSLFENDEVPLAPRNKASAPSYLENHRKRLRDRFLNGGADAMPDYEILELILFRAIPRQDVKPLANRLMSVFETFNAVISAPSERLEEIKGVGPAVVTELKIVEAAAHRLAKISISNRPLISSWDAVVSYCRTTMSHRATEQFRVLFLDRKNALISDETLSDGTVDHVQIYPREIIKRALQLEASALIIVHNHPSGNTSPSEDDIILTRDIDKATATLGIVLHDHIIIGRSEEVSLKADGYY